MLGTEVFVIFINTYARNCDFYCFYQIVISYVKNSILILNNGFKVVSQSRTCISKIKIYCQAIECTINRAIQLAIPKNPENHIIMLISSAQILILILGTGSLAARLATAGLLPDFRTGYWLGSWEIILVRVREAIDRLRIWVGNYK